MTLRKGIFQLLLSQPGESVSAHCQSVLYFPKSLDKWECVWGKLGARADYVSADAKQKDHVLLLQSEGQQKSV